MIVFGQDQNHIERGQGMEKKEIIFSTAKEIFLKGLGYTFVQDNFETELKAFDQQFKALVKTVSEAYKTIE